jgi:hypothetical protein
LHIFETDLVDFTYEVGATKLRAGDVYLFTLEQCLAGAVSLPDVPSSVVRDALKAIADLAFPEAAGVIGLAPLAWTVPNNGYTPSPGGPVVTTAPHLAVSFNGVFGTPTAVEEVWSFGLKCAHPAGDQDQDALNGIATACKAAFSASVKDFLTNVCVLTETRVARVDGNGHWERNADGSYKVGRDIGPVAGSNPPGIRYPLQTALVVSLTTHRPGSSGRGRIYLPYQGWALDNRWLIDAETTQRALNVGKALVNGVSAAAGAVQIVSGGALVSGTRTAPFMTPVTGVRVGHVVDTMRSRRNRQVEAYSSSGLA